MLSLLLVLSAGCSGESEAPAEPNLDRPLSEVREIQFTQGSTNEGRLVLIQVSE